VSFQDGLRRLGYIEGQNLRIERRYAEGSEERLPQLANELIQSGTDVIFTIGLATALAAAKETKKIPIIFAGGGDPVAIGLIKSLSHPGGTVTGLSLVAIELAAKRIQLLKEIFPAASRVAVLWNPNYSINKLELEEASRAAGMLGLAIVPFEIYKREDLEGAFDAMVRERADALFLISSAVTFPNRTQIARLAAAVRMPTLVPLREYVEAGLMTSYGPSFADHCRRAAIYVDQILKGSSPADLPVQLPTRLEFVINAKVARAIGFGVSPMLVTRADEVIE
jgi:putative ABC transport system substrate-binding protein